MNSKRQPVFKLAAYCMRAHKWINAKLCLVFACLSVLICLFAAFTLSIETRRQDLFEQTVSSNYFFGDEDVSAQLAQRSLPEFRHSEIGIYDLSGFMEKNVGVNVPTVTTNYVTVTFYGTDRSFRFDAEQEPQYLWLYKLQNASDDEFYPFTEADASELKLRFGKDSFYIGELPSGENDALVSERMLNGYGLRAEDVLGKNLSIRLGENGDIEVDDYMSVIGMRYVRVTGVIVKEYYELSGHSEDWQIRPSVIFSRENGVNLPPVTRHVYLLNEWSDLGEGELGDIASEYGLTYCGVAAYQQREFLNKIKTVVLNVYYVVGSVLALSLVLTVMLVMNKFVLAFSRTGGILLSCGLGSNNLYKLLFAQVVLMFAASLPLALVGSVVGYAAITELVALGTKISMSLSPTLMAQLLALSIAAVFAAAMLFFVFALLRIRRKSVLELLKT